MEIKFLPDRFILLVESDTDSCIALTKLLEAHGYAVECAATVAEAMAQMENQPTQYGAMAKRSRAPVSAPRIGNAGARRTQSPPAREEMTGRRSVICLRRLT